MADWVVLNNDESVDYTDSLPSPPNFAYAVQRSTSNVTNGMASPTTFSMQDTTASLQANDGQSLKIDISLLSSSAAQFMTPARLESRPVINMGHFSDPSKPSAPITTPVRQEGGSFSKTVYFYPSTQRGAPRILPQTLNPHRVPFGTPRFGPPLPAPPHMDPHCRIINDIAESPTSVTPTRYISPYAQLNKDFGKEGRWSKSNANTSITSTAVHKDTSHPTQGQYGANNGGLVNTALHEKVATSKTTNTAPSLATAEKLVSKVLKLRTTVVNQEGHSGVVTALHGTVAAPKSTNTILTLADQVALVARGSTVNAEKLVSKTPKIKTAVTTEGGLEGPVFTSSTPKTTAPKMTKVPRKASGGGSGAPTRTPSTDNSAVSKAPKVTIADVVSGSGDSVRVHVMTNTAAKAATVSTTLADDESSKAVSCLSSTTEKTAVKIKETSGAATNVPSSKKVAGPQSQIAATNLADQGKFGSSGVLADAQVSAASKTSNNPPSRETLMSTKPKTADQKAVKSVVQDADTAEPKTPKRRQSSSHPNARNSKIAKKITPPNQSTSAEIQKTPVRDTSRLISLGTPNSQGTLKQQSITRWTVRSAASGGSLNLGDDCDTARPSIVPEVDSPLARKVSQVAAHKAASIVPEVASPLARKASAQVASTVPEVASALARSREVVVQKAEVVEVRGYPSFPDGDVLIISPINSKTWTLHSTILCNSSPVLKNIISKQEPHHIKKKDREDGMAVKWKLIMIEEPEAKHNDPEGLIFKSFKAVSVLDKRANLSQFEMPLNVNGLDARPQFNKLYDNFFKCLYNIAPAFASKAEDPESREYILDAHKLVEAATLLDAVAAVRAPVEAKLLRLNTVLWTYLESRPESWVHLAARLQSPLMFSEAIIHIVGKFDLRGGLDEDVLMDKEGRHGELGRQIWDLIVKKARELKDKKLRTERRLIEYYPNRMLHEETEDSIPGRAIYSEDIYFWQALTLARQFCASVYMANNHHRGSDAGINFYRQVFACTYLRPETLGGFYKYFPMTLKGKQRLMQVLDMIKADLKPIVQELLVNSSKGDRGPEAPALDHLTCVDVLDEELPWVVPTVQTDGDIEMSGAL